MKVLQLIDTLHFGGAQKLLLILARALRGREDISLSVASLESLKNAFMADELRSLGVEVVEFPPHVRRQLLDYERALEVSDYITRKRFDVIHTHLVFANILGVYAGWRTGIPVVTTLHRLREEPRVRRSLHYLVESWAVRKGARRIIAVGNAVAEAQRPRFGGRQIDVIHNAIDVQPPLSAEERQRARLELAGDAGRLIVISVGRMVVEKGYFDLLEAFVSLRSYGDPQGLLENALLVIVGGGWMHEELEERIRSLGLQKNVLLTGVRVDVPRLLAASDVFVVSSHTEGLPVSMLEGMAAGLPVVSTRVGEIEYVVTPETGILVPPKQPMLLGAALAKMLNDPQLRNEAGAAARRLIQERFGAQAWSDRMLDLYREMIKW